MTKISTIVLLGGSGVGKSMILNSLIRKNIFQSGVSVGSRLTREVQLHLEPRLRWELIDTPGTNPDNKEETLQEIQEAFQVGKHYKLFFCCTLNEGRIYHSDVRMISSILNCLSNFTFSNNPDYNGQDRCIHFGIFVNKSPFELMNEETAKEVIKKKFKEKLEEKGFPVQFVEFIPREEKADQSTFLSVNTSVIIQKKIQTHLSQELISTKANLDFLNDHQLLFTKKAQLCTFEEESFRIQQQQEDQIDQSNNRLRCLFEQISEQEHISQVYQEEKKSFEDKPMKGFEKKAKKEFKRIEAQTKRLFAKKLF